MARLDNHGTGRVPLSKFCSRTLDSEWRFGESEAYLRNPDAGDETSLCLGRPVVVPNYIHGVSCCVVAPKLYIMCCVGWCGSIFGEVRAAPGCPGCTCQCE